MKPFTKLISLALSTVVMMGIGKGQETSPFHYRLQVRVEPAQHKLEAEATIEHPPSSRFYLYKGLTVRQVAADGKPVGFHLDSSLAPLPFSQGSAAVVVEAPDVQNLRIKYGGEISEVVNGVNMISPQLVELALYGAWYPLFEGLKNFTFEVQANFPQGFPTTTNGLRREQRNEDERSITVWTSLTPGFDIVLLASPLLHQLTGGVEATQLEIYSYRLPEPLQKSKIDGLVAGMNRLSSRYGPPRVKGILRLVYSPRSGWGYSRIPLIVVSEERALGVLSQESGEAKDFRDNCHEMAHFWWTLADPATPNGWIDEGLAEYSAVCLTVERYGKAFAEVRKAEYREHASQSKTPSSIAETEPSSPDREINWYDKAPLMFLEAQRRFGQEPLDKLLRAMYIRFAGTGRATTALFLEEAGRQMGKEAQAFFREELYRKSSVGTAGSH